MGIWMQILSMALNAILGGGLLLTFLTLRSYKKKSEGEAAQATAQAKVVERQAEESEIDNVQKVATMWRELSEKLDQKLQSRDEQLEQLQKGMNELQMEIKNLRNITARIARSLDKIDAKNYETIVAQIKEDLANHNG